MRKLLFIILLLFCIIHRNELYYMYHKLTRVKETSQSITKIPATNFSTSSKQFDFRFVKTSDQYNISDDMIMYDNEEFKSYASHYTDLINRTFTTEHLRGLMEILITDSRSFGDDENGNEAGECRMIGKDSYIIIAAHSSDNDKVLLHEICHAMQNRYMKIFNKIRREWEHCDEYVSDYAETNIDEDFAETGAFYLAGETGSNNPKFELFKIFFNEIPVEERK